MREKGRNGVFYLNDLKEKDVDYAVTEMREYCARRGYTGIQITPLPGDFTKIALPKVDTAHLRNPIPDMFQDGILNPTNLQKIANTTKEGLEITTYVHSLMRKMKADGLRYEIVDKNAPAYLFPNGMELNGYDIVKGERRMVSHRSYRIDPGRANEPAIPAPHFSECTPHLSDIADN